MSRTHRRAEKVTGNMLGMYFHGFIKDGVRDISVGNKRVPVSVHDGSHSKTG